MDERTRHALQAIFGMGAGGFLAAPPGLDGDSGLGIAGITGAPRPRGEWDVVASARAPDLPGHELTFVTLADGTLIVDEDVADGAPAPLADAVEQTLRPPYRAAALRQDDDIWAVAAKEVTLIDLPDIEGAALEMTRIGDATTFAVDGESSLPPGNVRRLLDGYDGDVVLTAERIDGHTWVADVWKL